MEEAKIINRINLSQLTNKFSIDDIEIGLISLFVTENNFEVRNIRLKNILAKSQSSISREIKTHLQLKKVTLDLMTLEKIFELLQGDEEKKQSGTFYTPQFIVDYISSNVIQGDSKVIDISCGCGAFLIGALKHLKVITNKTIIELIEDNIFGVDISEIAIERAKTRLTLFALINGEDKDAINFNLYVGDSLTFDFSTLRNIPPHGFDVVVGNPPYAKLSSNYKVEELSLRFSTLLNEKARPNLYVLFFELMLSLINIKGARLGVIIPLSIAYSSDRSVARLREIIYSTNGKWQFSFYDRSPDSLFGDNIKTRNSIVFLEVGNEEYSLSTTKLIRWNSKIRSELFKNVHFQDIRTFSISDYIPKISTDDELRIFMKLQANSLKLKDFIDPLPLMTKEDLGADRYVYYYSTAYNWLPFFRDLPDSKDLDNKKGGLNSSKKIVLQNKKQADLIYAILSSRLVYWLWVVIGDGFHLTESFIEQIPINPDIFSDKTKKILESLGSKLRTTVRQFPIYKVNNGKTIGNYNLLRCGSIINSIDEVLLSELSASQNFGDFLNTMYIGHISAGRLEYKNWQNLNWDVLQQRI